MDLWEFHNLKLHGEDQTDQQQIQGAKIYSRAKELLREGSGTIPIAQRALFKMHASKCLQQSPRQLDRWIKIVEKSKTIYKENLQNIIQNSNLMKYLPNHSPPKIL